MTFPIPPSSGRLPLTDGAVRSQAHTCRTRTVFGHCSKNSTFITHSVMTLTLGGIVPILQLKKQALEEVHLLAQGHDSITAYNIIPGVKRPPFMLWPRNLGRAQRSSSCLCVRHAAAIGCLLGPHQS